MRILFLTENFPPETNAAATRVYERACYWASWGHEVTILTCAPNFPHGKLFDGYKNHWRKVEEMGDLRIVRVKTYVAANEGTFRRTTDFVSFMISAFFAGLFEKQPQHSSTMLLSHCKTKCSHYQKLVSHYQICSHYQSWYSNTKHNQL